MSYDYGRFNWFELVTGDQAPARAFYPELFGWKLEPMDMPGGQSYPLLKAGGVPFGGLRDLPKPGLPPHWLSYVSVADVEASGNWPGKVVTEVVPASDFWEAEPEHQDYLVRNPGGYTCHFPRKGWVLPKRSSAK